MRGAAALLVLLAAAPAAAQAPAPPQQQHKPQQPPPPPAKAQWRPSTESLHDYLAGGMQLFRIDESDTGGVTEWVYWLTGPYKGGAPGLVRCRESFSLSSADKGAEPVVTPLALGCRMLVQPYDVH